MRSRAMLDPHVFRQYDIRGVVGETLTDEIMRSIGQACGTHLRRVEGERVAVGRDVRPSSERFAGAAIEGLLASGCDVFDIGMVPSSLLYYSIRDLEVDGGLMVTASHNPPQYNGIKLRRGEKPFTSDEIANLYKMIIAGDLLEGNGESQTADVVPSYVETVSRRVELGSRSLMVVVDAGNGTNGPLVSEILTRLDVDHHCLFCEPDGTFPNHHPDPSKRENLRDLRNKVRELEADIGVAYDGDGDRLGVIDEYGSVVDPDQYLVLLARAIFSHEAGHAVFDVRSSKALIDQVEQLGATVVLSEAGYPNILRHMRRLEAELGGESTGHVYFNDPAINFDDAVFATLKLLEYLSNVRHSLSTIIAEMPHFFTTPEIRLELPRGRKVEVSEEVATIFEDEGFETIDIDGVRIKFSDGWALIRPSNTEEVLSLRFEGRTEEALNRIVDRVRGALQECQVNLGEVSHSVQQQPGTPTQGDV